MEFTVSFAPLRPAGFVNFCGAGRGGARLAFRGAGRGGAAYFSAGRGGVGRREHPCRLVNIISGSSGANGGIPGAGIYETIEVAIMMMMMMMMMIVMMMLNIMALIILRGPNMC